MGLRLEKADLSVVGKASSVSSSSDGRGSHSVSGVSNRGSSSVSSVGRGSHGVAGVGNGGSSVSSHGSSSDNGGGSDGEGLLVDVGLSGDLDIDVGLSGDLNVHVGLSGDLLVDVGLGRDLDINVGLSGRVEVGVGHGRIVVSSIHSTVGDGRGSSIASSHNRGGSIASSPSVAVASISSGVSVSSSMSISTSRQNDSSVGHGQTGKGGNLKKKIRIISLSHFTFFAFCNGLIGLTYEGLHCDCEYCYCCRNRLKLKCSGSAFIVEAVNIDLLGQLEGVAGLCRPRV